MELKIEVIPDALDEDGDPMWVSLDEAIAKNVKPIAEGHARKLVEQLFEKECREAIKEQIGVAVSELFSKGFQRTDSYGTAKGEPVTMAEEVMRIATKYMEDKVTSRGRDDYSGKPRLYWSVAAVCDEALKELRAEQKATAKDMLAKMLAAKVASAAD